MLEERLIKPDLFIRYDYTENKFNGEVMLVAKLPPMNSVGAYNERKRSKI